MFIFIQQQILITYTPLLTWLYFSLYVELQLILKFIPKKWGGDGGNIGSIMSMIGKNCQSVDNCIFRHCTYIYCLKIHNSLMFYLLTMYIHRFIFKNDIIFWIFWIQFCTYFGPFDIAAWKHYYVHCQ
jgi:hypothetical protein